MAVEALAGVSGIHASRSVALLPQGDGASVADKFSQALERAGTSAAPTAGQLSPTLQGMLNALDRVDLQARSVSDYAVQAEQSGGTLTPGEIVNLTMRCQEFTFQCQITSNIANRSSDGVQQLFRQQG